jgi:hypothetical protein
MKQPIDPLKHVLVLYKLAPVGLLDASLHAGDEAGLIFEHAGNRVFHQLLSVLAISRGQLLKPRFNVRWKVYFHALQGTPKEALRQHAGRKHCVPDCNELRKRVGFPATGSRRACCDC